MFFKQGKQEAASIFALDSTMGTHDSPEIRNMNQSSSLNQLLLSPNPKSKKSQGIQAMIGSINCSGCS
jgi:hypothetical protein